MDRTGFIVVLLCALTFFGLQVYVAKEYPPAPPRPAALHAATSSAASPPAPSSSIPASAPTVSEATVSVPSVPEKTTVLENDFIKLTLSSLGASIKQVELKKHREGDGHVILNADAHDHILALTGWTPAGAFQVQSAPGSTSFAAPVGANLTWTRTYTLGKDYVVSVRDSIANAGAAEAILPPYALCVGRAEPLLVGGHYQAASNFYLGAGWLTSSKFRLTTVNDFNPSGWISVRPGRDLFTSDTVDPSPLRWLGVENQFFAVLLTAKDRTIPQATFRCFNARDAEGRVPPEAEPDLEAFANFPEVRLPAAHALDLDYTLYTGPKEYERLNALGQNQGELMNYDGVLPFSVIIVPMLSVLHFFHGAFGNYGVAIILLTLLIKAITWPLQSFANRSGKRMQAVAPKIKELQAKYKDQPEKLNTETFALYRDYGVNPFGGCLPALVQMPVFFSLYFMLQNAVELRGQSFLWVHDLTQPDTILSFPLGFVVPFLGATHFTLNPLPLLVTGLTMVMMRMTPQLGDPSQAKVAQFMPLVFLFIFYNFAAGLSLYYVINNCVSIIQIYRNLRKPLPELKRKPKKA